MLVSQKSPRFSVLRKLDSVNVLILLALIVWIAYFWHSASFGLYIDDYSRVAKAMGMTWSELWNIILKIFSGSGQGRPFHDSLIYLFSFLGAKLGGLYAIYWIGYVIVTVNSFLFYTLLTRLSNDRVFAVTGALAFCLFPADTTKVWLTSLFGLQSSLMFLLFALHCYLSGKRKLSYLFIFCSLLSYETAFLVFLAVPLLREKWDSRLIGKLVRHTLVLGTMIVCIVIIRKVMGEGRVAELDFLSTLRISVRHMIIGPLTSMKMFLVRPIETLRALKNGHLSVFFPLLCFAGLAWVLSRLKLDTSGNTLRLTTSLKRVFPLKIPDFFKHLAKLALSGLIMLVLAYPFTLIGSANNTNNINTRIHLAAVVGASILCACICSSIFFVAGTYRKKRLASTGLAGFLALLIGFGLLVQQDCITSWQYQRAFWSDLIKLCPDMTNGTRIFVEATSLRNPKQMVANTWAVSRVLDQTYKFPDDWKLTPRVYRLPLGWQKKIVSDEKFFELEVFRGQGMVVEPPDRNRKFKSSSVIFLEAKNGQLTRRAEPLIIKDQAFPLKPKSASELPPFEKGHLYDYLIRSSEEDLVNYIK